MLSALIGINDSLIAQARTIVSLYVSSGVTSGHVNPRLPSVSPGMLCVSEELFQDD